MTEYLKQNILCEFTTEELKNEIAGREQALKEEYAIKRLERYGAITEGSENHEFMLKALAEHKFLLGVL